MENLWSSIVSWAAQNPDAAVKLVGILVTAILSLITGGVKIHLSKVAAEGALDDVTREIEKELRFADRNNAIARADKVKASLANLSAHAMPKPVAKTFEKSVTRAHEYWEGPGRE